MSVFKVKTKSEEVVLTTSDLMELLFSKIIKDFSQEKREMSTTLCSKLQANKVLDRTSPLELAHMAFVAGFYYAGFMEKNDVKFETTSSVPDISSGESKTDQGSL